MERAALIQLAFVCTQNAARSQMAEAIGRHLAETRYPGLRVCSAGARPSGKVNPNAIRVIEELGISMESHWSKSLDEIDSDALDYVITLCDDAAEHCPVIPGATTLHWGLEDPACLQGEGEEVLAAFRMTRNEIKRRLLRLLATVESETF